MLYFDKTVDETLAELETSQGGLSVTDASERLRIYGPNAIKINGDPLWKKLLEPFANVFMLVLFVAAIISIFHGDTLDAVIIGVIIAVSAIIYYVQRFSTERILRSLQKHSAQRIDTLRDGHVKAIDAQNLVPGDVIILREGDKVPADARLIDSQNVRVDESQLTGESLPISKYTQALTGTKEVYEQSNMLFQGSFVIAGMASAVITATGNQTEFGQLAALTSDRTMKSPVQEKIDKLLSHIIAAVGGLAIVAFGLAMLRGTEISEAIRFVMALSVSAVPESLPVAISVVLVLGMRRMAAKKALVRTMRSIETVGVITTIATDKTGTLTKNKLTVQETWQLPHAKTHLASVAHHTVNHGSGKTHDPLDVAMIEYTQAENAVQMKGSHIASLPFDQSVAMSGNIWYSKGTHQLLVKGAPEHVMSRSNMTANERQQAEDALTRLTSAGYRVIAIAVSDIAGPIETFARLHKKASFEFVGFLAVADVLRPEAKRAISAALSAGVTVRMITGDHFETAFHIGEKLGMVTSRDQVFDSRHMRTMSDEQLASTIDNIRVFSRVVPEDKYRILSLLKKHNITAMTGDGVNDVPALTNAHVGVAMGSGSQIAKDAGDIILLDDNFKSIITAMREGRIIFANIRRMLFYLLATSIGGSLAMVGALIVGLPIPLLPVQILWINLVTDTSMVIPLGLEPGEKDIMKRQPKNPNTPILSKYMISRIILVALSMAGVALVLYAMFYATYGHEYARSIVFCALVVMQWANAFNARSDFESIFSRLRVWNGKFYIGLTVAVTLQALAIFGPLQGVLHMTPVAIGDLFITGVIAFVLPIVLVELHKLIGRRGRRADA